MIIIFYNNPNLELTRKLNYLRTKKKSTCQLPTPPSLVASVINTKIYHFFTELMISVKRQILENTQQIEQQIYYVY